MNFFSRLVNILVSSFIYIIVDSSGLGNFFEILVEVVLRLLKFVLNLRCLEFFFGIVGGER